MDSILNMTVEDFLNRTPSGDGYQICVKNHKTEKKDAVNFYLTKHSAAKKYHNRLVQIPLEYIKMIL